MSRVCRTLGSAGASEKPMFWRRDHGALAGKSVAAALEAGVPVAKAFNTCGVENMADPHCPQGDVFMPVAGDDAQARARVIALATLMGFDAIDLGLLKAARYLEPFAMVWIEMALRLGHGRDFAFVRQRRG